MSDDVGKVPDSPDFKPASGAESKRNKKVKDQDGSLAPQPEDSLRAKMAYLENEPGGSGTDDINLDLVLNIPVNIAMQVGTSSISIRDLLKLNQGSVIELDRLAGEPLDVMVNGTLIAHGEVVVINEKYGIRLTDVISAEERIQKLK